MIYILAQSVFIGTFSRELNLQNQLLFLETTCHISPSITLLAPSHFHGPTSLNLVFTFVIKAQQMVIFHPMAKSSVKEGAVPASTASW